MSVPSSTGSASPAPASSASPASQNPASTPKTSATGNETPANQSAAPKEPEWGSLKRKVKVNGVEREVTAEEAFRDYNKYSGADEKFKSAKQIQAENDAKIAKFKENRIDTLKDLGYDKKQIKEILENDLLSLIEEESLTPEQVAQREKDARLQAYEDERKQREEEQLTAKEQAENARERQQLEHDLVSALQGSKLPKTPLLVKWAAQKLLGAHMNEYEMSPADAVKETENEFRGALHDTLSSMDMDQRIAYLGPQFVEELREHSVQSVKKAESPFVKQNKAAKQAPKPKEDGPAPKINATDYWRKKLNNL